MEFADADIAPKEHDKMVKASVGGHVIVRKDRQEEKPFEDDLLAALEAADALDPTNHRLIEFIDPVAIENLTWTNPALEVRTRIMGHPVHITADEIIVYSGGFLRDGEE